MIAIYLNDTIAEDVFFDANHDALDRLFECSEIIQSKRRTFSGSKISFKTSCEIIETLESLESVLDNDRYELLYREITNKLNVKFWNTNQTQRNDCQYFEIDTSESPPSNKDVSMTTLAEVAEDSVAGSNTVMLLHPSVLSETPNRTVNFLIIPFEDRDNPINCSSQGCYCSGKLEEWLNHTCEEQFKYQSFDRTPLDKESCLRNKQVYTPVEGRKNQGRQLYSGRGNYWYIDNFHKGEAAHIEVFDRKGQHIGEANLNGEINFKKNGNSKNIEL